MDTRIFLRYCIILSTLIVFIRLRNKIRYDSSKESYLFFWINFMLFRVVTLSFIRYKGEKCKGEDSIERTAKQSISMAAN